MGQCKVCNKSSIFLPVNQLGLCPQCAKQFDLDKVRRIQIIQDSVQLIQDSKNLDTKLSRLEVLLENARAMQIYENVGIEVTDPPLSHFIDHRGELHDQIITEHLDEEYTNLLLSFDTPSITPKVKIGKISKIIAKAKEYQIKLNVTSKLDPFIENAESLNHKMQLNIFISDAEKAEFKGSNKKALDKYLEALYFLKTDNIDDSLQDNEINKLESKISELKGE